MTPPTMPSTVTTMPLRPANARTTEPCDSTRRRWANQSRVMLAIDAAREEGRAEGVQAGYRQGWRWGLACGTIAGALVVGLCWGGWLMVSVPTAAATAARVL